jgi:hypothetical protein
LEKPRNSKDHAGLINPFEDPQYERTDNRDDDPRTKGILSTPFHTMTREEKDAFQKMEDIIGLSEDEANRLAHASSLSPHTSSILGVISKEQLWDSLKDRWLSITLSNPIAVVRSANTTL